MDKFIAVRVKLQTAKRFQEFPKTHFKWHTEATPSMLVFSILNIL
jgi:hypothetical protein